MVIGGLTRCSTRLRQQQQQQQQQGAKRRKRGKINNDDIALVPSPRTVHHWFKGKSLYLRGKHSCDQNYSPRYLCRIPGTWLEQSISHDFKTQKKEFHKMMIQKKKKKTATAALEPCEKESFLLAPLFNHHILHRRGDQPLFALPDFSPLHTSPEKDSSTWVMLGSTLYIFGGFDRYGLDSREIYYLQNPASAITAVRDIPSNLKIAGCMINTRHDAKVVALAGKVYIFGGEHNFNDEDDGNHVWAEVFEPQPHSPQGHCRALPSPSDCTPFVNFAVAVENKKRIIVGWVTGRTSEYDVLGNSWVNSEFSASVTLRSPFCQPIAVGSTLYWVDNKFMAYDLEKKLLMAGLIEDLFIQQTLCDPDSPIAPADFQLSLLHLAGDFFGLIWAERGYEPKALHFTTIRACRTTRNDTDKCCIRASVLSCQTFVSQFPLHLEDRAMLV